MKDATRREREWHNQRFAYGGDKRAKSQARIGYFVSGYAKRLFNSYQQKCNLRVLDVGCGRGIERARLFTSNNCTYTGIDISEQCIIANTEELSKGYASANARFICCDANTLEEVDGQYDLVILSGTLHHLELKSAIPALLSVTSKEGEVVMWEPMGTNPAVNLFRLMTPSIRTPDEHPLTFHDLELIRNYFPNSVFSFHVLSSFLLLPVACIPAVRKSEVFSRLAGYFGRLDHALGRLPIIRRLHWIVIIRAKS